MRRRFFTFFSAMSLLLCVAVCVLGVRALKVTAPDYLSVRPSTATFIAARCDRGGVTIVLPPAPAPAAAEAAVRTLTSVMSNGDVAYGCDASHDDRRTAVQAWVEGATRDGSSVRDLPIDWPMDFTANSLIPTYSLAVMYGNARAAAHLALNEHRLPRWAFVLALLAYPLRGSCCGFTA